MQRKEGKWEKENRREEIIISRMRFWTHTTKQHKYKMCMRRKIVNIFCQKYEAERRNIMQNLTKNIFI